MGEEFIPRAIPRVKIALYGPSNAGKTLFRNMLLRKDASSPKPSEKSQEEEVLREYKRPTEFGTAISVEKYKLTLVDVPGRPEYKDERLDALSKIVGWLFMYDATDPSSAEILMSMIKDELEPARKLKSAIAMMVVGTKRDLGVNGDAVAKGEEIAKYLSKHTTMLYGYSVPHVVISCVDMNNVTLTFLCIESINFDLRPPKTVIEKLKSTEKPIGTEEKPTSVQAPKSEATATPPEIKPAEAPLEKPSELVEEIRVEEVEVPTPPPTTETLHEEPLKELESLETGIEKLPEVPSPVDVMKEALPKEVKIERPSPRLPKEKAPAHRVKPIEIEIEPNDELWNIARTLRGKIPFVSRCFIMAYDRNRIHVSHGGDKELTQEIRDLLSSLIKVVGAAGIFEPSAMYISGEKKAYGIIFGKRTMVLELEGENVQDMLFLLSSLSVEESYKTPIPIEKSESINLALNKTENVWDIARSIKGIIPNAISCYIVTKENGTYVVAHDSDAFLAKEQEDFIRNIMNLASLVDNLTDARLIILIGKQSIIISKKMGYLIIKIKDRPTLDLLRIVTSAR